MNWVISRSTNRISGVWLLCSRIVIFLSKGDLCPASESVRKLRTRNPKFLTSKHHINSRISGERTWQFSRWSMGVFTVPDLPITEKIRLGYKIVYTLPESGMRTAPDIISGLRYMNRYIEVITLNLGCILISAFLAGCSSKSVSLWDVGCQSWRHLMADVLYATFCEHLALLNA